MSISNSTLLKIASIGGIITCSVGLMSVWKIKDRIRQTDYYKEALKSLRTHKGAVSLLGEPIKDGSIDLENKDIYCNSEKAYIQVPVRGPKQKGTLHLWANKLTDSENWIVKRVELGLENEPDRRLLVKNITNEQDNI